MERRYLAVKEVAETLGISRAFLYKQIKSGAFPSLKIGTRIVVPADWEAKVVTKAL